MKTWLISATLFLTFTILVTAKPHHETLSPHVKVAHDECLKELGLTKEEVHKGKISGKYAERNCFWACISKKLGVIDDKGNINKEKAVENFPPHYPQNNISSIVDACSEQKGTDECETTALFHKCIKNLLPWPPLKGELKKVHDQCRAKLDLTDDDLEKLGQTRDQAKEDCFLACIFKERGLTKDDGTLNTEDIFAKTQKYLTKDETQILVDDCGKDQGANACETALLLYKCFEKNGAFDHYRFGLSPPPQAE